MKWIFLYCFLFSSPVFAQTLSLEEVLAQVKTHPSIQAARWDAKAARAMRRSESWLPDPQAGIMFDEVPLNSPSLGNADMTNYSVSQEIPFPGKLVSKSKALKNEFKAKEQIVSSTERARIFDAKKAFFELAANQQLIRSKETTIGYYRVVLATQEKQYQTGTRTMSPNGGMTSDQGRGSQIDSGLGDLLMTRMKKAEAEAGLHDLHHQHNSLEARLNLLMGRDPETPINELVLPGMKILNGDAKTLQAKVLSQNSDLKAMELMLKKFKGEVSVARQSLIPTVEPMFTYQRRQNRDNSYALSFNLNLPLWFNRDKATIDAAVALRSKAQAELETQKRNLETDFYALFNHAQRHRLIVQQYKDEIVPLAKSAVDTTLASYQAGMMPSAGLLQKLIGYEESNAMYWTMWTDYQTDYALLEQLAGEEL